MNLSDYKAAILLARKFSDTFTAARGYDLRKIKSIKDISPAKRRRIVEYSDFLRPLVVYGYKTRQIKGRAAVLDYYSSTFGIADIPKGIKKAVLLVDNNGNVLKKKGNQYELKNGVRIERIFFSDTERLAIARGNHTVIETLWDEYKPDAMAMVAGIHPIRSGGAPAMAYNLAAALRMVGFFGGKYSSTKNPDHDIGDWFTGVDLYFNFDGRVARSYLTEESRRYKARATLAKKVKDARRSNTQAMSALSDFEKSLSYAMKSMEPSARHTYRAQSERALVKLKKRVESTVKTLERLSKELYTGDAS